MTDEQIKNYLKIQLNLYWQFLKELKTNKKLKSLV